MAIKSDEVRRVVAQMREHLRKRAGAEKDEQMRLFFLLQEKLIEPWTEWLEEIALATKAGRISGSDVFRVALRQMANMTASALQNAIQGMVDNISPEFEIDIREEFIFGLRRALSDGGVVMEVEKIEERLAERGASAPAEPLAINPDHILKAKLH